MISRGLSGFRVTFPLIDDDVIDLSDVAFDIAGFKRLFQFLFGILQAVVGFPPVLPKTSVAILQEYHGVQASFAAEFRH